MNTALLRHVARMQLQSNQDDVVDKIALLRKYQAQTVDKKLSRKDELEQGSQVALSSKIAKTENDEVVSTVESVCRHVEVPTLQMSPDKVLEDTVPSEDCVEHEDDEWVFVGSPPFK